MSLQPELRQALRPHDGTVQKQEDFAATVFGNNYSRPVIGYQGDLDAMGRREVAAFHSRHYAPQNLTVALVGDVDPAQVCKMSSAVLRLSGRWLQEIAQPVAAPCNLVRGWHS